MIYKFKDYSDKETYIELEHNDNVAHIKIGKESINISWADMCDLRDLLDKFINNTPLSII